MDLDLPHLRRAAFWQQGRAYRCERRHSTDMAQRLSSICSRLARRKAARGRQADGRRADGVSLRARVL